MIRGAIVGLGRVVEVGGVGATEIADAGAEDHRQVIGGFQARGQVGAGLALHDVVLAAAWDIRLGVLAAPIEDAAAHRGVDRAIHWYVLLRTGGHEAHDQLVLATKQTERPAEVDVQGVLHLTITVLR